MSKKIVWLLVVVLLVAGGILVYMKLYPPQPPVNPEAVERLKQSEALNPTGTDNTLVAKRDPKLAPNKTAQFQVEYDQIKDKLPYEQNGVKIEYLEETGRILARVSGVSSAEEFKAKKLTTENALKNEGVTDLCGLGILWMPPDDLPPLPLQERLSPGCTL